MINYVEIFEILCAVFDDDVASDGDAVAAMARVESLWSALRPEFKPINPFHNGSASL